METHIGRGGYGPALAGGLLALRQLAETPELRVEFPALLDEAPRRAWADELVALESRAREAGRGLKQSEALAMLEEALAAGDGLVPESVSVHEFADGALASLDPFTGMYWPADLDELRRATQGAFFGVGIRISLRDLALTVSSPLANTPAADAGLQAGDQIVSVDGRSTAGWTLARAVRAITGPEGTRVVLGVRREGEEEVRDVSIVRSRIDLDSVQGWSLLPAEAGVEAGWSHWIDAAAGIGYVRLTQFLPQTADDLKAGLEGLRADGSLHGLILDLRFNPGGLLGSAIEIADLFVDDGPLVETIDAAGNVRDKYQARRRGTDTELPLAVLVNRGSASAAEIVAGILGDTGRAAVVGERTYGKGSVQNVFWNPGERSTRPPRWGMKVTTHHYRLPGGAVIHRAPGADRWGIDPTIEIPVPDQFVAWGVELRQELDVLRGPGAAPPLLTRSHPAVQRVGLDPLDPQDEGARERVEVPGLQPEDLLDLGLDPQLEAALLLLKTRRVEAAALGGS
ncbi:putative carboxy-terminal-processing protease [Phycisphaera mikurensis NBRC 102666]|uniref:Putative carboxy-terminal-processing protease n=1 Tax=Phycisphaera mikurensis (strain NBRC 102666 / KCTC 22515 / FYK2301M01) TaxID=1142394 RepID=I0IEK7_PHYMF|nr:putative carboxy-terminal-processing protease [Phycisphaera mikurensis NBRC 102666]